MTSQAGPVRQPVGDLIAFDVSRQSPEQIALLFARWKEQRKQRQHGEQPQQAERPPRLKAMAPIVRAAARASTAQALAPQASTRPASTPPASTPPASMPVAEKSPQAGPPCNRSPAAAGQVHYSATFAAVLATRIEPNKARLIWNPEAGLSTVRRPTPARRHSRLKWILAGAASVAALVALPNDALWLPSGKMHISSGEAIPTQAAVVATVTELAPSAEPAYPMDFDMAEPFAAIATAAPVAAEWSLQPTIDVALLKVTPITQVAHRTLMPRLKPPVPLVHTASKTIEAREPLPSAYPQSMPKLRPITPVELTIVPSRAKALIGVSAAAAVTAVSEAPAAEPNASERGAESDDRGPAGLTQRGNDKDNLFGNSGIAASADEAPGSTDPGGSAHPGSGAGTSGGDTGSGNTGGGDAAGAGGDASGGNASGGDTSGGDTSGGDTSGGNTSGGDASGGDASGGASGGDASGGNTSGGDASGGDTSGGDASGGDASGGDASGGDASGGDSSGGNSSGGDASGGNSSGGDGSGGNSSGGDGSGSDASGGDGSGGDASGGGDAGDGASGGGGTEE